MASAAQVELLREVSARELARIVGCSPQRIARELPHVPAAWRSPGGRWHCPLWAWQRYQEERGELHLARRVS